MSIARGVLKKVRTRLLGGMGEKLVSVLADTSSDAPTRFAAPKRDLYEQLEHGKTDSGKIETGSATNGTTKPSEKTQGPSKSS